MKDIIEYPMPDFIKEDLIRRGLNPDNFGCVAIETAAAESAQQRSERLKKEEIDRLWHVIKESRDRINELSQMEELP
jgi:hypothetical protein